MLFLLIKSYTALDFESCIRLGNLSSREVKNAFDDVIGAVLKWKSFAMEAGLSEKRRNEIWTFLDKQIKVI